MKKIKEEKGITLMVLVVMIIILLILASVGIISWKQAIDYAAYNEFTSELKVMQTKVNELNQNNKTDIGEKLADNQISVLEIDEIKKIIYKDKTNEEIEQVKNGFRYCSKEWIKENLELDSVTRPYLINVEKRYVVSYIGFEYKDKVYYMTEQLENGQYNVEYNNKNPQTGSFEINTQKEGNRWKVEVSNIKYDGYVSNWQIKYKLITNDFWETSNELTFYINEPGEYTISVVHGDEVSLGMKSMTLYNEYVSDSLILSYDAINNLGENEHSSDTTIWKDLSQSNNDAQITGAIWGNKYLSFDGIDDFAKTISEVDYKESNVITVQFVLLDISDNQKTQMIFESSRNWNENNTGYGITINEGGINNIRITYHHERGYNLKYTGDNVFEPKTLSVYTAIINTNKKYNSFIELYKDSEYIKLNESSGNNYDISNTKFLNYPIYLGSRAGDALFCQMKLGAIRIYNRELSQKEIKSNYEIDKIRFKQ